MSSGEEMKKKCDFIIYVVDCARNLSTFLQFLLIEVTSGFIDRKCVKIFDVIWLVHYKEMFLFECCSCPPIVIHEIYNMQWCVLINKEEAKDFVFCQLASIATTIGWVAMKFGADIDIPVRMIHHCFGDPLTFPLVPPPCFNLLNTLVYD